MIRITDQGQNLSGFNPTQTEAKKIAHALVKILGIVVAEKPKTIQTLLLDFGVQLPQQPSAKELLDAMMEMIALRYVPFNTALSKIIEEVVPELDNQPFDSYSSDASALTANVGEGAAQGAATGGIWGAALGTLGGIFNFASSSKQQKIEKDKASAMSFSSMMQYKTVKEQNKGISKSSTTKIISITIIGLFLLAGGVLLIKNRRKINVS